MMPYQIEAVDNFLRALPQRPRRVLEIGSDLPCAVGVSLARKTGAAVICLNPDRDFPEQTVHGAPMPVAEVAALRGDGLHLPFPDETFDAVICVAAMEHIPRLESFLKEVHRVLRPRGLFYTGFSPIWSSGRGHHVYARAGEKEARFWKPGKNPVPDYGHLLLSPEEMRAYLATGPCCEELLDPIIHWIYRSDAINRYRYEDYRRVFRESPLLLEKIVIRDTDSPPDGETEAKLRGRYGVKANFRCVGINAVLRKPPRGPFREKLEFAVRTGAKYAAHRVVYSIYAALRSRIPELTRVARRWR